ncbi:MAG: hypothetical protein C4547_03040 [Phycisphaerales bacterium]|nr:MAG: hypothetical protein C4547_03040 [Phycisphaerales bacterium]
MLSSSVLPDFNLSDDNGCQQSFEDLLAEINVILVTRSVRVSHSPGNELVRSFLAEIQGTGYGSLCGFDIRSHDAFCNVRRGPHVVSQRREFVTICDSGGLVRRLWGMDGDAWILIVSASRRILGEGPLADVGRLVTEFGRDVSLSPGRPTGGRF